MKPKKAAGTADSHEAIASLVKTLHETQERLHELTGGQVDAVLHQGGQSYLLHAAQQNLRNSEEAQRLSALTQSAILNALPAHIALLDPQGVIIAVNDGWRRFSSSAALQSAETFVGQNYLEICERAVGEDAEGAREAAAGIRRVLTGGARDFSMEYSCHSPSGRSWFRLMVTPLDDASPSRAAVMHLDVTDRKRTEDQLLSKTAMLEAQVHSSPDGILIISEHDSKILQNRRMTELWEIPPEMAQDSGEPRQLDWVIRQVKDSSAFAGKVAYLHHHPNEISRDEIELVNGKFFDCSSAPVQGADGKYYGRIWTFRDITERKQAEKKTAEQVRLMAMAERVGKLGAWALEFPGPHVVWSDEIYHIHEVPPDFQPDFESALTFYPAAARQKLREALLSKLPYDLELDFITAKGQKRFVRTTSAVEVKDDQVVRRYGLLQDLTERKRSETRFRALVDSNVQGVVFWNRNGAIAGANDAFLKLVGYTREDLESGRIDWIKLTPPEYAHLDRHSLEEISVGGVCSPYRKEYIRKDGSRVPILLGAAAFEDDPDQGVCFVIDLTERELAERAQRLSEERFSHAFEYAPNGMIILSTDGNLITANRTLCHLIGYSLAELTQKKIHDITHPDDIGEELEYISRMLSGEIHHYEIEKRYLHKDGHEVWVHLNSSLVRDLNNQPLYFIKQIQDVSQIKSANEQIEEQAALIDEASDAIFSRDLENRVVFWNKGAERLYGWSAEEVEGRCVKDLLQLDSDQFETAEKKLQQTGQWNGEIQTKTKAGATIFINSRWTLLRDSKGQPRSVLTIDTDVTERRKLEQQFLRAQRMESIGTLAGGIAHDLNNILAPILMSIDVLKSLSANAEALEILETIRVSAKRGADIVRQVLSFARGVEGKRIEVQPKHIVEDIENIVKNTFPKNVNVTTIIPRNTWTILGDPTQIHQILLNLCVNARDALPNGGNLTLKVENFVLDDQYSVMKDRAKPGPYVQISVIDSGTGIPPDLRERIFEPFFTTKEVTKGTGLGLSTVMAIVKSHGGMIDVYSEVNQGTTFKVYLPAIETSPDRERMQTAEITLPRGNGEMILVVDDESSILTITCQTLLAFGYRVLKAADGAEALAIYAENKNEVAVVLTDMMMPVLHGPALIRALKRMNPDLKIIAASGFSAEADVPSATEHGVDRFITKPYTAGTLLKTLHETLH